MWRIWGSQGKCNSPKVTRLRPLGRAADSVAWALCSAPCQSLIRFRVCEVGILSKNQTLICTAEYKRLQDGHRRPGQCEGRTSYIINSEASYFYFRSSTTVFSRLHSGLVQSPTSCPYYPEGSKKAQSLISLRGSSAVYEFIKYLSDSYFPPLSQYLLSSYILGTIYDWTKCTGECPIPSRTLMRPGKQIGLHEVICGIR